MSDEWSADFERTDADFTWTPIAGTQVSGYAIYGRVKRRKHWWSLRKTWQDTLLNYGTVPRDTGAKP